MSEPTACDVTHHARELAATSYRLATTAGCVTEQRWARVKGDATGGLRRGAWYPVVRLTSRDAVVAVESQQLRLPRGALQFASVRPHTWTLVTCPADARETPVRPGALYAVCPSCRERAPLGGSPQSLRCTRCNGVYKVGWEEWFVWGRR